MTGFETVTRSEYWSTLNLSSSEGTSHADRKKRLEQKLKWKLQNMENDCRMLPQKTTARCRLRNGLQACQTWTSGRRCSGTHWWGSGGRCLPGTSCWRQHVAASWQQSPGFAAAQWSADRRRTPRWCQRHQEPQWRGSCSGSRGGSPRSEETNVSIRLWHHQCFTSF